MKYNFLSYLTLMIFTFFISIAHATTLVSTVPNGLITKTDTAEAATSLHDVYIYNETNKIQTYTMTYILTPQNRNTAVFNEYVILNPSQSFKKTQKMASPIQYTFKGTYYLTAETIVKSDNGLEADSIVTALIQVHG